MASRPVAHAAVAVLLGAAATTSVGCGAAPLPVLPDVPRPIQVGVSHEQPFLISRVQPRLPPEARRTGLRGPVIVEVLVDDLGDVTVRQVVRGDPLLHADAIRAVQQWKYIPVVWRGHATPVIQSVTVTFLNAD
jgi:TonB family protein